MKVQVLLIAAAYAAEDNHEDDTWVGPSAESTGAISVRGGQRQLSSDGERR